MAITKKVNALFKLMERFLIQNEISSYDTSLLDEFACDPKTLERYLKEIEASYSHILSIKKSRTKYWKLVKVSDIFEEFVKNSEDISQLFLMAQEFDPEIFKELEKGTLSKISNKDRDIFMFRNSIMEELQSSKVKSIFENLKRAIINSEYRDIVYTYDETETHEDSKCLRLLFMDNNWYVVILDKHKKLLFRRLSFIKEVRYSKKETFQRKEIEAYLKFLSTAQNAMTMYDVKAKKATIKARLNIAKYFKKEMKKFLPSQTFVKNCDDGSVIFTLEYTQELEILPFIQKWLPDLVILEPKELRDAYVEKLEETLRTYRK